MVKAPLGVRSEQNGKSLLASSKMVKDASGSLPYFLLRARSARPQNLNIHPGGEAFL